MTKSPQPRITPPFGYDEVATLQKTDRVLLPHGSTPNFCRTTNALAISSSEFVTAARDYPIVFSSSDGGKTFAPVAVLGLVDSQNLFVNDSGEWDQTCYVPAYVRRYPFCVSRVYVDGKPRGERMVCVAKAYLDPQGIALFDTKGDALPSWQPIERLLTEYENDLELTAQMSAIFAKLELFSPFQFQIMQNESPTLTLQGMYRIDEKKLSELRPVSIKALLNKGLMACIYAHFHSLESFGRLYQRAVVRANTPKTGEFR